MFTYLINAQMTSVCGKKEKRNIWHAVESQLFKLTLVQCVTEYQ